MTFLRPALTKVMRSYLLNAARASAWDLCELAPVFNSSLIVALAQRHDRSLRHHLDDAHSVSLPHPSLVLIYTAKLSALKYPRLVRCFHSANASAALSCFLASQPTSRYQNWSNRQTAWIATLHAKVPTWARSVMWPWFTGGLCESFAMSNSIRSLVGSPASPTPCLLACLLSCFLACLFHGCISTMSSRVLVTSSPRVSPRAQGQPKAKVAGSYQPCDGRVARSSERQAVNASRNLRRFGRSNRRETLHLFEGQFGSIRCLLSAFCECCSATGRYQQSQSFHQLSAQEVYQMYFCPMREERF